jgi:hypothetical protein
MFEENVVVHPELSPSQAAPVYRDLVRTALVSDSGVQACDNDHNTDTERDIFFVDMS